MVVVLRGGGGGVARVKCGPRWWCLEVAVFQVDRVWLRGCLAAAVAFEGGGSVWRWRVEAVEAYDGGCGGTG